MICFRIIDTSFSFRFIIIWVLSVSVLAWNFSWNWRKLLWKQNNHSRLGNDLHAQKSTSVSIQCQYQCPATAFCNGCANKFSLSYGETTHDSFTIKISFGPQIRWLFSLGLPTPQIWFLEIFLLFQELKSVLRIPFWYYWRLKTNASNALQDVSEEIFLQCFMKWEHQCGKIPLPYSHKVGEGPTIYKLNHKNK